MDILTELELIKIGLETIIMTMSMLPGNDSYIKVLEIIKEKVLIVIKHLKANKNRK